ncbi:MULTISPECIES: hypothetical protein [unclassified Niallia]|uniref:hypothetical protein n=1 Tax=unclassified Niallia TaxID=2837522 RepID=UPI0030FD0599
MKQSKVKKQLNTLIEHSVKNKGKTFCLLLKDQKTTLVGVTKENIEPHAAIIYLQKDKKTYLKGTFDGVSYNSSVIEYLNKTSPIIIGVDNRDKEDTIVYFQSNDFCERITSNSSFELDDTLYIYWEYGFYSCLTICTYDPIQEEIVRETVYADNEPLKRFLKSVVRKVLPNNEELFESDTMSSYINEYLENQYNNEEEQSEYYEEVEYDDNQNIW